MEHLDTLEAEAIHILREVTATSPRPVLLFSGGKDSITLLHLAQKAFAPARIPFPVLHVDTGLDFPEVLELRDRWVERLEVRLVVASVEQALADGVVIDNGHTSRNRLQTGTLLQALSREGFTAAFGGGRRDEDRARAKERIVSHRDAFGQWDPRRQRPELWSLYNTAVHPGEHVRVFPLSNWTELDIWQYIAQEAFPIPDLYYAAPRPVVRRDGMWFAVTQDFPAEPAEEVVTRTVRYRTVGDATLTGCIDSHATTAHEVVAEVAVARVSERGATRADDRFSEAAMEDRKREGYF